MVFIYKRYGRNYRQNMLQKFLLTGILSLILLSNFALNTKANSNNYPNFISIKDVINPQNIKALNNSLNSDVSKKRINLIFIPIDQPDLANTRTVSTDLLKGQAGDISAFLNIQPFKSNLDKFNFWFLDQSISENYSNALLYNKDSIFDMKFTVPILMYKELPRESAISNYIEYSNDRKNISSLTMGASKMATQGSGINSTTLSHELGHAIFSLADEYSEGQGNPTIKFPNCAPDVETAKLWWDSEIGKINDEFYGYRDGLIERQITQGLLKKEGDNLYSPVYKYLVDGNIELDASGDMIVDRWEIIPNKNQILDEEEFRVTLNNKGQCFGAYEGEAYRPTPNSLMNGGLFFDSVGLAAGHKVLSLFNKGEYPKLAIDPLQSYIDDPINFLQSAISPFDCKKISNEETNKIFLSCELLNQNPYLSQDVELSYSLIESKVVDPNSEVLYPVSREEKFYPCKLSADKKNIQCNLIDITDLEKSSAIPKKYYLGLQHNSRKMYNQELNPKNYGLDFGYPATTKLNTGEADYEFLLSNFKTVIEPKIIPLKDLPKIEVITDQARTINLINVQIPKSSNPPITVLSKTGSHYELLAYSIGLGVLSSISLFARKRLNSRTNQ